ncbi:MAG TPA: hypothetical protein VIF60_23445 [Burkholderiaceae bacterium]
MTQSQIILLVMAPLIVWRIYSRYRKLVGKQQVRPVKLWFSAILFPLAFILAGVVCSNNVNALICLFGGGVAGFALSFLGLRLTRFETQGGALLYTPNAYIGMGLMMVLMGRLAYRVAGVWGGGAQAAPGSPQSLTGSPVTLFIVGMLFCYYAPYSAAILRRHAKAKAETTELEANNETMPRNG